MGGQVGGRRWQRREGRPDTGSSADREEREKRGGVPLQRANTHSSFFALPGGAQQQLQRCTIVVFCCLFVQGPGDDDLSLFVGISGSLMWLWCDYAGEPGLPEPLKVTVDVLALMFLSVLCMRSARQTCCFFIPGKGLVFSQEGHDALVVFFTVQQTRRASPCHIKSSAYWRVCLSRLGARIMCICCQISSVRKRTRAPPHTLLLEVLH